MDHYLNRVRLIFRWLYNARGHEVSGKNILSSEWETPTFVKIKGKKTKRISPYSERAMGS
jgi:integrase/recombinase XerD